MKSLGRNSFFVAISIWGALASPVGCTSRPGGHLDASADAEVSDATTADLGDGHTNPADAGVPDVTGGDTDTADTGVPDVAAGDTGTADAGVRDVPADATSTPDAGVPDVTAGETRTADASEDAGKADVGKADVGATDATTVDGQAKATVDLCAPTGMFDFSVHGAGFEAWDGAMIRVAAVEPTMGEKTFPVVVRQTTVIAGGAFAMACPLSLSRNSSYPSFGLFIDIDGDGRCSPTDLGYESLYFAWLATIDKALTSPMSGWPVIGGRIGGTSTTPFCAYYGF